MCVEVDPQQAIFSAVRFAIENLGYDVYDTDLPPEDTPYPFVYLGNTQQIDKRTKTQIIGDIHQMVDVWHDSPKRRGDVSKMVLEIKKALFALNRVGNYSIDVRLSDFYIGMDDSTNIKLMRANLDFLIKFT